MTIAEVAKEKQVSRATVQRWIEEKRFKGAKLKRTLTGWVWVIPRRAVESLKRPTRGRPRGSRK